MPIEPQAPYISSKEASKKYGLTHDHIGLLCRQGKIQGLLWGRMWFISEPSLVSYIQKNSELKEARKEALSKQWRTAWTAAFIGFSLYACSANYAAADFISMPPRVAAAPQAAPSVSLTAIALKVGEIKNQIPTPKLPVAPVVASLEVEEQHDSMFFSHVGEGLYIVGEAVAKTFELKPAETFHVVYAKEFEPEVEVKEPLSALLTSAVVRAKVATHALPVLEVAYTVSAEAPVFTVKNILSGLEMVRENLNIKSFPLIDTTPHVKTVSAVTSVEQTEVASFEPLSMFFTAAAINASAVAATLPPPLTSYEAPKVEQTLTAENFLAGTMFANETLHRVNDNMLALYVRSFNSFANVVAFDAAAGAHVWGKTFGMFGERFVSDLARLNDAQVDFYFAAADSLQEKYNSLADAVEESQMSDSSISVASSNFAPTFTIPGKAQVANVWDGLVSFLAETLFTPKEISPTESASQPQQNTPVSSTSAKPATAPSFGTAPAQTKPQTVVLPSTPIAQPQATIARAPASYFSTADLVTQKELNDQFDAWMLVVRNLISNNAGASNSNNTFLGLPSGNTIINNYALSQRIDKLDGVTITNSSINGISDFSNLGGGASALTDLSDTLIASPAYGDLLMFNGTKWVNIATSSLGITGGSGSLTGTTGQLAYFSATNSAVGTSSLFISTAGNVGIGTTTPDDKLTVWGTGELAKFGDDTTSAASIAFQAGRGLVGYLNNFATLQGGVNKGLKLIVNGSTFGGGTTALTIIGDSSALVPIGNIGIGTTSPYAKLSVVGDIVAARFFATTTATSTFAGAIQATCFSVDGTTCITGGAASFSGTVGQVEYFSATNSAVGTSSLFISTAGNVGIGTTSPATRLEVNSTDSTNGQLRLGNGTVYSSFIVKSNGDLHISPNTGAATYVGPNYGATNSFSVQANGKIIQNSTSNSTFTGTGSFGIGTTSPWAKFSINNSTADAAGQPLFAVASSTASATTTAFIITNSGNVGIGLTSPEKPLHVYSTATGVTYGLKLTNKAGDVVGNGPGILFDTGASVDSSGRGKGAIVYSYGTQTTWGRGDMQFLQNSAADTSNPSLANSVMTITNAGNVGIGTTSPNAALDISNGNIALELGADSSATTRTNATTKIARIVTAPYTNGTTPVAAILANNSSSINQLSVGGGTSAAYTATQIDFFTAANSTTLTGNSRLTVNSAGNVGIGTTSPWGKLSINNSTNDTAGQPLFAVASSTASATTTAFIITNSGNVGVGTSNPLYPLQVVGSNSNTAGLYVQNTATASFVPVAEFYAPNNTGVGSASQIRFGQSTVTNNAAEWRFVYNGNGSASNRVDFGSYGVSAPVFSYTLGGNFGIGTTTPWAKFSINNSTADTAGQALFAVASSTASATTTVFIITNTGNVGIGTALPGAALQVQGAGNAEQGSATPNGVLHLSASATSQGLTLGIVGGSTAHAWIQSRVMNAATFSNLVLNPSGGNVGVGTTSPYAKLSVVGQVAAESFVATSTTATSTFMGSVGIGSSTIGIIGGTASYLTIDRSANNNYALLTYASSTGVMSHAAFANSNGVVGTISTNGSATAYNTSSDRRIKDGIATTSLGIDTLLKLPVREFSFKNDPLHATTTGFIAQELFTVFPYAVTTNGDSGENDLAAGTLPWSVDYGRITPLLVKAIQDIATISSSFKDALVAWLGDATNGITKLFAKEVHTEKLCVGNTCVSEEQFLAMVAASGGQTSSSAPEAPAPEVVTQDEAASSTPEVPPAPEEQVEPEPEPEPVVQNEEAPADSLTVAE